MALAEGGLAEAEAVRAAVGVPLLEVELSGLTSVASGSLNIGFAQTFGSFLVANILSRSSQIARTLLALWILKISGRAMVTSTSFNVVFTTKRW